MTYESTTKLAIKWTLTHVAPSFARRILAENESALIHADKWKSLLRSKDVTSSEPSAAVPGPFGILAQGAYQAIQHLGQFGLSICIQRTQSIISFHESR